MENNIKVGLLIIATQKYDTFLKALFETADQYFLKDCDVTYFLFTDTAKEFPEHNVVKVPQEHKQWPYITLERYHTFIQNKELLTTQDYLFYTDADMIFENEVGNEILSDRVATVHPGIYGGRGNVETNPNSLAYIAPNEQVLYFAGGFNGGSTNEFLRMSEMISTNVDIDRANQIVAKWHDESHLNRWFLDNPPTKVLDCGYCYSYSHPRNHKPKLIAIDKDHQAFGNHGEGASEVL